MAGTPRKTVPKRKTPMRRAPVKKTVAVAKKVATLARQVQKLNKVSYSKVSTILTVANSQALISPYNSYNVSKTLGGNVLPIWGYQSGSLVDQEKAYLNKKHIQVSIRQNNEPNLIRYTMFLVSLKDDANDTTTFDPSTGELTLANLNHYTFLGTDQVRMSPRFFNIHAVRRFTMGFEGTAGPAADTFSERRFKFDITPKQKMYSNPKGNVFYNNSFLFPKDPSMNYFVVIFNDNSTIDLESNRVDITVSDDWAIPS